MKSRRLPSAWRQWGVIAALALLVAGCAVNPQEKRWKEEKALQSKLGYFVYGDIGLQVRQELAANTVVEQTLTHNKGAATEGVYLRLVSADPEHRVRYLTLAQLESVHLDVTGKTPSYYQLRTAATRNTVLPYVEYYRCYRECAPFYDELGMVRLHEKKVVDGKVEKDAGYVSANRRVYMNHLRLLEGVQVMDITVLSEEQAKALYSQYKGEWDRQWCEAAKSENDYYTRARADTKARLGLPADIRPRSRFDLPAECR